MKLAPWITAHSMNQSQAATFFGVQRATLHRWLNGSVPKPHNLRMITRRTKREVTANDFIIVEGEKC